MDRFLVERGELLQLASAAQLANPLRRTREPVTVEGLRVAVRPVLDAFVAAALDAVAPVASEN